MSFLPLLLSKYRTYIYVIVFYAFSLLGTYQCGIRHAVQKQERSNYVEIERRINESIKEQDRIETIKNRIGNSRKINPANDKRDSCLLSNNPFTISCVE